MLRTYYKGLQDDCLVIKCAHADGGPYDDPYYKFSLDHIAGVKDEALALAGDEKEAVRYIIESLTDIVKAGNHALADAFGSAAYHYFDMLLGNSQGETFFVRLKTLREKFGENYFPFIQ
ncbi:MAG: hypothetical protein IKM46_02175 [Clostridia bacterium]|nr:hypothetical protein [Clostridia bacterium]